MRAVKKLSFDRGLRLTLSFCLAFSLSVFTPATALADEGASARANGALSEAAADVSDNVPVADSAPSFSAEETLAAAEERDTAPTELGYMPGEVVVVYEPDATDSEKEQAIQPVEGELPEEEAVFDIGTIAAVEISDDVTVDTAIELIEADPAVQYALPNYLAVPYDAAEASPSSLTSSGAENVSDQWHLNYVKAPDAWQQLAAAGVAVQPVKVAVIDTGASLTHPDLKNIVNRNTSIEVIHPENSHDIAKWSSRPLRGDGYTNGNAQINEKSSHGTHVSGIVAGEAGNGGILGVASGGTTSLANRLVDLTVIDGFSLLVYNNTSKRWEASGTVEDIVFSLQYARDAGCAVVNMSLGFPASDSKTTTLFEDLTWNLTNRYNMLVIAAAGNDGADTPSLPAACESVMGVISISERNSMSAPSDTFTSPAWMTGTTTRSSFSSYGSWCDISAPGESILSSYLENGTTDRYAYMGGTSMASPVVAGVAAMVRAANPRLSAVQVRNIINATAVDLHTPGKDAQSGYGAIDAQAAVAEALKADPASDEYVSKTNLSRAQVSGVKATYAFTGKSIKPVPVVKYAGNTLRSGTDYTVSYSAGCTNAGTYTITVSGKGSYTGQAKVTYRIVVPAASVAYSTHVQSIGWQAEARDGARGGTSGRGLRVEAFRVRLVNQPYSGGIEVSAHVQSIGWQGWARYPAVSGTSGRSLRVEALKIRLTGEMAKNYDVYYRAHVQSVGDTGWAKNGEPCGSAGYSYRMEAVYIRLVPKGGAAPGPAAGHFVHPLVTYSTHVQSVGWQGPVSDGATGGTSGRGLRVEAFRVGLSNQECPGDIRVKSHVQSIGWQDWVYGGGTSGTSGRSLRVEALRIELTGEMSRRYDVWYRTHCQKVGWTGWAKNGDPSGTAGYSYRMEAVQIRLVPKGGAAPGSTARSFYQR